ncbi:MAG TPA: hypothetical protein VFR68_07065 [Candidatus Dormibacteraeota bacterium]|nr:hypothetical protein [Candidatus Dormibacteraeota bacterium]
MGMLLAVGGGLALYQMTSLVLGPGGIRQLPLSLNLPSADVLELPATASNGSLAVGTLATPMAATPAPSHSPVYPAGRSARAAAASTTKGPAPAATATPRPKPPVRPTPTVPPVPDSGSD